MKNIFITQNEIFSQSTFNAIVNDFVYHRRSTPLLGEVFSLNTHMKIFYDLKDNTSIDRFEICSLISRLNGMLFDLDSVNVYDAHDQIVAFEQMISES